MSSSEKKGRIFKIIVSGDPNVGKTCLLNRICSGKFPLNTEATFGVNYLEKQVVVDNEPMRLLFWDTAGQESSRRSMVPLYYRNVHAVVFVYDVTKIASFQNLPHWIAELKEYQGQSEDIPKILVGNKCDVIDAIAVNANMARKFAVDNDMPLFQTSAFDDREAEHVNTIVMDLAHKLKNHRLMMNSSSLSTSSNDYFFIRTVKKKKKIRLFSFNKPW